MKAEIERLHLQLPPGFEGRAQRIGRLVGEALARQPTPGAGRIDAVRVGPLQVDARRSDRAVAEAIAAPIAAAIRAAGRGGPTS